MAVHLLAQDKVGYYKYYDCAKIFFLHENLFRPEWMSRLNFARKDLKYDSRPALYFILTFQPNKFPFDLSLLKSIEPEVLVPNQRERISTKMRNTIETTPNRNLRIGQSQQQQERQMTITPQSQRCQKRQMSDRELEYSLLQGNLQLQENLSLKEKKSLDFSANKQICRQQATQQKAGLNSQMHKSQQQYFRILEPISGEETCHKEQVRQKSVSLNSQRSSQCNNQILLQSQSSNQRHVLKEMHDEEDYENSVLYSQKTQIKKPRESDFHEQENRVFYNSRSQCQNSRIHNAYEAVQEEEDIEDQLMEREIYSQRQNHIQEQNMSYAMMNTQRKNQKGNVSAKIVNQTSNLKSQTLYISPAKGPCPQAISPSRPLHTPTRTIGSSPMSFPSQNKCLHRRKPEDEEMEEDQHQHQMYFQNQLPNKQICLSNSQAMRNMNLKIIAQKVANPPSFRERVNNSQHSLEAIQVCQSCHSPWQSQPVSQVSQAHIRHALHDNSNYMSQSQCSKNLESVRKNSKIQQLECPKMTNISPSKQIKGHFIAENQLVRQHNNSSLKVNDAPLRNFEPPRMSQVSPLRTANKQSHYEMEVEYNNFEQSQKPKSFDPSGNPLYQSYLNKKIHQKSQPELQTALKNTNYKAPKTNGNSIISNQINARAHSLQSQEYNNHVENAQFMVEYDEPDNRYLRRNSSSIKAVQLQRGYGQMSSQGR